MASSELVKRHPGTPLSLSSPIPPIEDISSSSRPLPTTPSHAQNPLSQPAYPRSATLASASTQTTSPAVPLPRPILGEVRLLAALTPTRAQRGALPQEDASAHRHGRERDGIAAGCRSWATAGARLSEQLKALVGGVRERSVQAVCAAWERRRRENVKLLEDSICSTSRPDRTNMPARFIALEGAPAGEHAEDPLYHRGHEQAGSGGRRGAAICEAVADGQEPAP